MAKKIYTEEEARERKNARQREYAKRTGYSSNQKYNKETYSRITIAVKRDIAEAYRNRCNELGIPYSRPLHETIEKIIGND